jgi:glutamine synthetase adenylyltransferase
LLDLEFIVQYLVLREAASSPQVVCRGTAEALRELGEADALTPHACHELLEALTLLRDVQMLLTLLGDGSSTADACRKPTLPPSRDAGAADSPGSTQISPPLPLVRGWHGD